MSEFHTPYSELTIIERLRNELVPRGTLPVVPLHLTNRFFNKEFIDQCINEVERIETYRAALGDKPNCLERLALILLCDSAYIDTVARAAEAAEKETAQ